MGSNLPTIANSLDFNIVAGAVLLGSASWLGFNRWKRTRSEGGLADEEGNRNLGDKL